MSKIFLRASESSREAAQKISDVRVGTEKIISMGDALRKIIDIVEQVSAQVQEISKSIRSMASSGEEIVGHIRNIETSSRTSAEEAETVSAATEEQTASVHEIANAATSLAHMANELQKEVQRFKL